MEATTEALDGLLDGMALSGVLYYGWLVVFVATFAGIWRSTLKATRLLCFVINQVATWAMVASGNLSLAILTERAAISVGVAAAALILGWLLFERRGQADLSAERW